MRVSRPPLIDTLESRLLFHGYGFGAGGEGYFHHGPYVPALPATAGPLTTAAYTAVENDLTNISAAKTNLHNDSETYEAAVQALLAAPTSAVTTAQTALANAKSAAQTLLQPDYAAVQAVYTVYLPTIQADRLTVWNDYKTSSPNLAADKAALAAEQALLQAALVGPETTLQMDRSSSWTAIQTAQGNLQTAINTDPTIAPSYALVQGDQGTLSTDQGQFATDLTTYLTDLNTTPTP